MVLILSWLYWRWRRQHFFNVNFIEINASELASSVERGPFEKVLGCGMS